MTDQPARLTPLGKILSIALIVGLIGFGSYIVMKRGSGGKVTQGGDGSEAWKQKLPIPPRYDGKRI